MSYPICYYVHTKKAESYPNVRSNLDKINGGVQIMKHDLADEPLLNQKEFTPSDVQIILEKIKRIYDIAIFE